MLKKFWNYWVALAPQILLSFLALVVIAVILPALGPKPSNACAPIGWLENPGPADGATNVSTTPDFSWTFERGLWGQNGDWINLYVWRCPEMIGSCQSIFHTKFETSGPVYSISWSEAGKVDPLDCNTTYYWQAYVSDACIGPMVPNATWHFTTGCPQQTHKACQNMACATVNGAGNNSCSSDADCFHHTCQGTTCAKVDGGGQSSCSSDAQCQPQTHKECRSMACATVDGAGTDTCSSDGDCSHLTCQDHACVRVSGAGTDNCPNNCQPQTHKECRSMACATVSGAGNNSCSGDSECFHYTCQGTTCAKVDGGGQSGCSSDAQCQPQTHLACQGMACVQVTGAGQNTCSSRWDCAHNVCQNNACTLISGAGQDSCSGNNDCVPQTHRECRSNACVVVSGSGGNQCNFDGDCVAASHSQCQNNACVIVSGPGASTCSSNADCAPAVQSALCDSLSVSRQSGNVPLTVNAVVAGHTVNGGSIVSYRFNFGDGAGDVVQSGQTLSHTYQNAGNFMASGFVTDNLGNQAGGNVNCQKVVSVNQPQVLGVVTPPAIPKTGAETTALLSLIGSGGLGLVLRKIKLGKKDWSLTEMTEEG